MATVTPSSTNSIQPFRFLDLSPELRNKIYELVLGFDRPVSLTSTTDIYLKHRSSHIAGCTFDTHPHLPNLNGSVADRKNVTWCVDLFANTQRKLDLPRSVLSLRHVCKQIDEEMRYMFFAINEFHFRDADYAQDLFTNMANPKATAAIEVLGFRFFSDNAPRLYPRLGTACPNVRVLKVTMNMEDKRVVLPVMHKSLRRARGVEAFASYLAGLEKLETFEIVGTDYVNETVDGIEKLVQVDINHPLAIGPWFKKKIEMAKMQRKIIGKEVMAREKREREKKEKAMKEKRKEQRKRNKERKMERERQRLEAERLERERQNMERLRLETGRLERERHARESQRRADRTAANRAAADRFYVDLTFFEGE
ncbi:hypothetical protein VE00_00482 [Pseudogymnoascus sp. WSF 3629]|nr:hypothetical protein VE00_00482 [Pseudogymnoascus sp. WSF 3629]